MLLCNLVLILKSSRVSDILEFGHVSTESLHDVPDEDVEPQGSRTSSPLYPAAEVTTEQSSQQRDASLDEEDLPDVEGTELTTSEHKSQHETSLSGKELPDTEEDDPQELENQSEDEDIIHDSMPANQSPEPHSPAQSEQEEEEDDDDAHSEGSYVLLVYITRSHVVLSFCS